MYLPVQKLCLIIEHNEETKKTLAIKHTLRFILGLPHATKISKVCSIVEHEPI
jgi:hypothetical protein